VRVHLDLAVAVTLTNNQTANQSRNARDEVNDEAAGEVEGAELCADLWRCGSGLLSDYW